MESSVKLTAGTDPPQIAAGDETTLPVSTSVRLCLTAVQKPPGESAVCVCVCVCYRTLYASWRLRIKPFEYQGIFSCAPSSEPVSKVSVAVLTLSFQTMKSIFALNSGLCFTEFKISHYTNQLFTYL